MSHSNKSAVISIDRIVARAYSRATELVERVRTAVLNLFPETIHQKVKISIQNIEGQGRIPITVVKAILENKKACETTTDYIFKQLPQKDRIILQDTVTQRLDEHCVFFVRIDKQSALLDKLQLATNPDVIAVKLRLRQYPRCNQSDAENLIRQRLQSIH